MKIKQLLEVVDKDYLDAVKIFVGDYDLFTPWYWYKWDSDIIQQYYDRKIIKFTWYGAYLLICVEGLERY